MAVELRCPDCRAKLRLDEAPEAGTEVECPKCGTAFPAPESEDESAAPKKKKKPARDADDADEKPKKAAKAAGAADGEKKADPKAPKKRKAKKRETSNVMLFGVIGAGLVLLGFASGVLIYLYGRTPKSVEMMNYLPEDCDSVQGLNLGHAQKYPEFYKALATTFTNTEFKVAGDALAKPLGASDMDNLTDYIVFGSAPKGASATVFRTKVDMDGSALAKLPGAQAKTLDGKTYYVADGFKAGPKLRVFAPTPRLIVYCPVDVPDPVFKKMLNGHADSKDKTIGARMGDLGKRVTRGTFWGFQMYDSVSKPPAGPAAGPAGSDDAQVALARTKSDSLNGAKGMGYKASIGSREVRFEVVVWCPDSEKSSNMSKKWNESDLGKGDEGTPPRWWTETVNSLGSKKIGAQLLANIGFGSSGELFYAKSAVETVDLKDALSGFATKITGNTGGGGATMPNMPPPGGPGGPPPAPGGPPPAPGGKQRRRVWARR